MLYMLKFISFKNHVKAAKQNVKGDEQRIKRVV